MWRQGKQFFGKIATNGPRHRKGHRQFQESSPDGTGAYHSIIFDHLGRPMIGRHKDGIERWCSGKIIFGHERQAVDTAQRGLALSYDNDLDLVAAPTGRVGEHVERRREIEFMEAFDTKMPTIVASSKVLPPSPVSGRSR